MMGEQIGAQGRFFYDFNLEEQIPQDHLLRQIDGVLDLNHLRRQLAPHYSHTGRPSIDPELMENTGTGMKTSRYFNPLGPRLIRANMLIF